MTVPRLARARAYAQRRMELWHEAVIILRRPAGVVPDVLTREVTPTYETPYYGAGATEESPANAAIWIVQKGPAIYLGDAGSLETRTAQVSLPWDAPKVHVEDLLEVVGCPYDTDLVGRTGTIESVGGGGRLRGSRLISVKGLYEESAWPAS